MHRQFGITIAFFVCSWSWKESIGKQNRCLYLRPFKTWAVSFYTMSKSINKKHNISDLIEVSLCAHTQTAILYYVLYYVFMSLIWKHTWYSKIQWIIPKILNVLSCGTLKWNLLCFKRKRLISILKHTKHSKNGQYSGYGLHPAAPKDATYVQETRILHQSLQQ